MTCQPLTIVGTRLADASPLSTSRDTTTGQRAASIPSAKIESPRSVKTMRLSTPARETAMSVGAANPRIAMDETHDICGVSGTFPTKKPTTRRMTAVIFKDRVT